MNNIKTELKEYLSLSDLNLDEKSKIKDILNTYNSSEEKTIKDAINKMSLNFAVAPKERIIEEDGAGGYIDVFYNLVTGEETITKNEFKTPFSESTSSGYTNLIVNETRFNSSINKYFYYKHICRPIKIIKNNKIVAEAYAYGSTLAQFLRLDGAYYNSSASSGFIRFANGDTYVGNFIIGFKVSETVSITPKESGDSCFADIPTTGILYIAQNNRYVVAESNFSIVSMKSNTSLIQAATRPGNTEDIVNARISVGAASSTADGFILRVIPRFPTTAENFTSVTIPKNAIYFTVFGGDFMPLGTFNK